ncbi:unnamed protein product [Strongylus vulgaris]|uniref:Uncharacterized protein n=1 Tax=Strongylus vulgaris TaxID=40348 RepID=A0A3P7LEQ6_STRVU|nr:unnamed protein product [Strongylus vulgaris]
MAKNEGKDQVYYLSENEFWSDIKDEYIQRIAEMDPNDVYPSNNPGPTNPDGSVNFECHCVGHLVASPCGHEFREAITCQKSATEEELEAGKCGEELLAFMECVMRTQCFKSKTVLFLCSYIVNLFIHQLKLCDFSVAER